jgi:cell division protein FtsN
MQFKYFVYLIIAGFSGIISISHHRLFTAFRQAVIINSFCMPGSVDTIKNKRILNPDIKIQVGAFRKESNALVLKERLSSLIDQLVIIVPDDGFFKVQITSFSSRREMADLLPTLGLLGMKNIWVLPEPKQEEVKPQVVMLPDSVPEEKGKEIRLTVPEVEKPALNKSTIALQVGVYHEKSKALRAQRRITAKLKLKVDIFFDGEYHHVIVMGFSVLEDTYKYYPDLTKLGYHDIYVLEDYANQR